MEFCDLSNFSKQEIKETLNQVRFPVSIAIIGDDGGDNYFNTGAAIRTAHCFLAKEIHLINRPSYYKKATMGNHKWENIISHYTLEQFVSSTNNRNLVIFERTLKVKCEPLNAFSFPDDPILVFGSERNGTPSWLLDRGHPCVTIEQYGLCNSLNLNVAIGIALNECVNSIKKRGYHGK